MEAGESGIERRSCALKLIKIGRQDAPTSAVASLLLVSDLRPHLRPAAWELISGTVVLVKSAARKVISSRGQPQKKYLVC